MAKRPGRSCSNVYKTVWASISSIAALSQTGLRAFENVRIGILRCRSMRMLGITLKALANSNPGLLQPWNSSSNPYSANSERVRGVACAAIRQRFQRYDSLVHRSQGLQQPWAGTSQRFQRNSSHMELLHILGSYRSQARQYSRQELKGIFLNDSKVQMGSS